MNLRDDVKAFVDGELDELRVEAMLTAMESDADLRGDIEAMRALGFELRRTSVDHEVKGAEKAMGRFDGRRRFLKWPIWISSVAMVALAMAVVFPPAGPASAVMTNIARSEVGQALPEQAADTGVSSTGETGATGGGGGGMSVSSQGTSDIDGAVGGREAKTENYQFHADPLDFAGEADGRTTRISQTNARDKTLTPDLIRTAGISVKVADAPAAMNEAMELAKRMGGYYQSNRVSKGQHQQAIADVTLRVPVTRFDSALSELRKLGEVIDDSSESQDVTAEIADVGARLKVLRAEEESYVTMLRMAKKVGEVLEIKDRLSTTRQEIESLTAQQKALKDQASYSTISCHFEERPKVDEPEAPNNWTDDSWANAVNGLKSVGRFLGQAAITLFVYAPIWLPLALVAWLIFRRRPTP